LWCCDIAGGGFHRTEIAAESVLLRVGDVLVAEHQHGVAVHASGHRRHLVGRELLAQVDALDFTGEVGAGGVAGDDAQRHGAKARAFKGQRQAVHALKTSWQVPMLRRTQPKTDAMADTQHDRPRLAILPALIFSSRWLQLPLYLGLIVAQGVYVFLFIKELWHLVETATSITEQQIMLIVLGLIDVVMISNLLIMVIV